MYRASSLAHCRFVPFFAGVHPACRPPCRHDKTRPDRRRRGDAGGRLTFSGPTPSEAINAPPLRGPFRGGRSSMSAAPEKISILHDDYHAKHMGRTSDGRQFFLTSAFEPAIGESPGREFVALFLFDDDGTVIEDRIDDLGTRQELGLDR